MNKPVKSGEGVTATSGPSSGAIDTAAAIQTLKKDIANLKQRLDRRNFKVSKVAESYVFLINLVLCV